MTIEAPVARRPHNLAPNLESVRAVIVVQSAGQLSSCMGLAVTSMMTCKMLRAHGVHINVWNLPDAEALKCRLKAEEWNSDRPITHVIINTPGFIGPMCYAEMAMAWPEIAFVMLNHTGLAYLQIDHDGWRNIRWLLDLQSTLDNVLVAGNNPRFGAAIESEFGRPTLYLPNLYDLSIFKPLRPAPPSHSPLRIGSFAEGRPWKNQLVAAEGALSIARELGADLELYVNEDRWDQTKPLSKARGQLLEDLPGVSLRIVCWQPWHTFLRTVECMDLLIYPSFDEAFGMVPADGIAVGVPCVTSAALEWTPRTWQAMEPFDPASIRSVGLSLLHGRLGALQAGRRALTDYVESGIRRWIRYLAEGAKT